MPSRARSNAMPNKYGFQRLGDEVACIDCDVRDPAFRWPEKRQAQHKLAHVKEAERVAQREARQRARDARRLARQTQRENDLAYGKRDA